MLTVDIHETDDYISDFWHDYSSDSYLNFVYYSDLQLGKFIEYIQNQVFYKHTQLS